LDGLAREGNERARGGGGALSPEGEEGDNPRSCGDDEGHLVDVSIELNTLIEEANFEGAFSRALHSNRADLLGLALTRTLTLIGWPIS
jgi:hypothetical protein